VSRAPLLEGEPERVGRGRGATAVGDEDVDRTQVGLHGAHEVGHAVEIAGVVHVSVSAQRRRRPVDALARARGNGDACALR